MLACVQKLDAVMLFCGDDWVPDCRSVWFCCVFFLISCTSTVRFHSVSPQLEPSCMYPRPVASCIHPTARGQRLESCPGWLAGGIPPGCKSGWLAEWASSRGGPPAAWTPGLVGRCMDIFAGIGTALLPGSLWRLPPIFPPICKYAKCVVLLGF